MPDEDKGLWLSALATVVERFDAKRARLMAWLGTAVSLIALSTWTFLGLLEQRPPETQLATSASMLLVGYVSVKAAIAYLPGGLSGLVDTMVGESPGEPHDTASMTDFLLENRDHLGRRLSVILLADATPAFLAIILLAGSGGTAVPSLVLLQIFVILRFGIIVAEGLVLVLVLTPRVLHFFKRTLAQQEKLMEANPWLVDAVMKVTLLMNIGGAVLKAIFYGVQLVVVMQIAYGVAGGDMAAIRMVLVSVFGAALAAGCFDVWGRCRMLIHRRESVDRLYGDILLNQVTPDRYVEALREATRAGYAASFAPYKLPRSMWVAIERSWSEPRPPIPGYDASITAEVRGELEARKAGVRP